MGFSKPFFVFFKYCRVIFRPTHSGKIVDLKQRCKLGIIANPNLRVESRGEFD